MNEAEGSQPVFHPLENTFEASDEDDVDNMANGIAAIQNQISTTTTATTTTPATGTTTTTVAQRQNQVSCILYHAVYHPSLWCNIQGFKSKLATGTFHSLL